MGGLIIFIFVVGLIAVGIAVIKPELKKRRIAREEAQAEKDRLAAKLKQTKGEHDQLFS